MSQRRLGKHGVRISGFSCAFQVNRPQIYAAWSLLALAIVLARGAASGFQVPLSHLLILFAGLILPAFVLEAVLRRFRPDRLLAQPAFRLARLGRWQDVDDLQRRLFDAFGVRGLLAMLLGGLLLNLPVRALEFAVAIPFPLAHAPQWHWLLYIYMLMDLVVLSCCYAALVGLALRCVPLFPRLLIAVWALDIAVQLAIGQLMAGAPGVPPAVRAGLEALLDGNIRKVGISVAVWLPYLLLSQRINLTFRGRIRSPLPVPR